MFDFVTTLLQLLSGLAIILLAGFIFLVFFAFFGGYLMDSFFAVKRFIDRIRTRRHIRRQFENTSGLSLMWYPDVIKHDSVYDQVAHEHEFDPIAEKKMLSYCQADAQASAYMYLHPLNNHVSKDDQFFIKVEEFRNGIAL